MAMTIKQLSYFLAVVDTGRFTQAAALCRVAQPTLSKQIRSLETDLGESLLTRNGNSSVTSQRTKNFSVKSELRFV